MAKFLLLLFFLTIGFSSPFVYNYYRIAAQFRSFNPVSSQVQTTPPDSALVGQITANGTVALQPRNSSAFSPVDSTNNSFIQGEVIKTGPNSSASISFGKIGSLTLDSNTQLSLVNTNPTSFLVNQQSGIISYHPQDPDNPISSKILHLLVQFKSGISTVSIDAQTITIKAGDSDVVIAFENDANVTNLFTIPSGKTLIYNDVTHTYHYPRPTPARRTPYRSSKATNRR